MLEGLKLKFPISKGNDGFFSQIEIKLEWKKKERIGKRRKVIWTW